jgi:energy-coupling factor transporter transmembrane protein EcfT
MDFTLLLLTVFLAILAIVCIRIFFQFLMVFFRIVLLSLLLISFTRALINGKIGRTPFWPTREKPHKNSFNKIITDTLVTPKSKADSITLDHLLKNNTNETELEID